MCFRELVNMIFCLLSGERSKDPNHADYNIWFYVAR